MCVNCALYSIRARLIQLLVLERKLPQFTRVFSDQIPVLLAAKSVPHKGSYYSSWNIFVQVQAHLLFDPFCQNIFERVEKRFLMFILEPAIK